MFIYHNTIIGEHIAGDTSSNLHFRNNLFLGRDTPDRGIMKVGNSTSINTSDYNGYRPNKGVKEQYSWLAPPKGQKIYEPKPGDWKTFATLAEFQAGTGQEAHSIEVDFDIFEKMVPPDPNKKFAVYHAMDINFNLKPGSKAVDAGVVIPTVNEGFKGKAPDLGAIEVGAAPLHYGPRWLTWQPFYR
jgi:hypothetical protein